MISISHKQHVELAERARVVKGERHLRSVRDRCNMLEKDARKRQIPLDISRQALFQLLASACVYCDAEAVTLDRLDLAQGYNVQNVQPCCAMCFWLRGVVGDDFINVAHAIQSKAPCDAKLYHARKPKYFQYKAQVQRKGIAWALSKQEWESISAQECYFCASKAQWNRPERLENNQGFATGNVVAMCKQCHVLRGDFSESVFRKHVQRLASLK